LTSDTGNKRARLQSVIDWAGIDAVVFDIGGVFLLPHPEPIRAALDECGFPVEVDDLAFHRAHYRAARAVADLPFADTHTDFWQHYERAYLGEIGLGDGHLEDAMKAWLRVREIDVLGLWRWVQHRNVAALARFSGHGVPLAIVSNNDGTAVDQMQRFGVCQVGPGALTEVVAIVDSTALGVAKPDPAIFRPALAALGTAPERTLYVGDMVHADVVGARAAAMAVVQIDPYDYHADFDHPRLPDVDAVADQLFC
jgi:putative hydrolase of the HAD superfamily